MPRAQPLRGWYVISLRPLGRHGGVRDAAARLGATCVAVSTLRTEPLPAGSALAYALAAPRVIVTSPTAAREAAAQATLRVRRGQQWFALGAGTARALQRAGVARVAVPARGSDSEALLALPGLASVAGSAVGLLTAPGGRGLLARTLARRGATVRVAAVYRRIATPPRPARVRALAALPPARCALLLTSQEALAPLWSALPAAEQARWRRRPCVVASARMAAVAAGLGFERVLRAADARPAALLAALAEAAGAAGTGRFR
jgi:uroporphyrinogen-III synthase